MTVSGVMGFRSDQHTFISTLFALHSPCMQNCTIFHRKRIVIANKMVHIDLDIMSTMYEFSSVECKNVRSVRIKILENMDDTFLYEEGTD